MCMTMWRILQQKRCNLPQASHHDAVRNVCVHSVLAKTSHTLWNCSPTLTLQGKCFVWTTWKWAPRSESSRWKVMDWDKLFLTGCLQICVCVWSCLKDTFYSYNQWDFLHEILLSLSENKTKIAIGKWLCDSLNIRLVIILDEDEYFAKVCYYVFLNCETDFMVWKQHPGKLFEISDYCMLCPRYSALHLLWFWKQKWTIKMRFKGFL